MKINYELIWCYLRGHCVQTSSKNDKLCLDCDKLWKSDNSIFKGEIK